MRESAATFKGMQRRLIQLQAHARLLPCPQTDDQQRPVCDGGGGGGKRSAARLFAVPSALVAVPQAGNNDNDNNNNDNDNNTQHVHRHERKHKQHRAKLEGFPLSMASIQRARQRIQESTASCVAEMDVYVTARLVRVLSPLQDLRHAAETLLSSIQRLSSFVQRWNRFASLLSSTLNACPLSGFCAC